MHRTPPININISLSLFFITKFTTLPHSIKSFLEAFNSLPEAHLPSPHTPLTHYSIPQSLIWVRKVFNLDYLSGEISHDGVSRGNSSSQDEISRGNSRGNSSSQDRVSRGNSSSQNVDSIVSYPFP